MRWHCWRTITAVHTSGQWSKQDWDPSLLAARAHDCTLAAVCHCHYLHCKTNVVIIFTSEDLPGPDLPPGLWPALNRMAKERSPSLGFSHTSSASQRDDPKPVVSIFLSYVEKLIFRHICTYIYMNIHIYGKCLKNFHLIFLILIILSLSLG